MPRPATLAPAAPAPAAPVATEAPPTAEPNPADRLARALANLTAALEEQRVAVARWRSVIGALKTSTTGLSDSLNRYNASLGALGERVSGVHKQAEELEEWADSVLATHR
jgi:3-oxoacyl-ACP reductase-like protein